MDPEHRRAGLFNLVRPRRLIGFGYPVLNGKIVGSNPIAAIFVVHTNDLKIEDYFTATELPSTEFFVIHNTVTGRCQTIVAACCGDKFQLHVSKIISKISPFELIIWLHSLDRMQLEDFILENNDIFIDRNKMDEISERVVLFRSKLRSIIKTQK